MAKRKIIFNIAIIFVCVVLSEILIPCTFDYDFVQLPFKTGQGNYNLNDFRRKQVETVRSADDYIYTIEKRSSLLSIMNEKTQRTIYYNSKDRNLSLLIHPLTKKIYLGTDKKLIILEHDKEKETIILLYQTVIKSKYSATYEDNSGMYIVGAEKIQLSDDTGLIECVSGGTLLIFNLDGNLVRTYYGSSPIIDYTVHPNRKRLLIVRADEWSGNLTYYEGEKSTVILNNPLLYAKPNENWTEIEVLTKEDSQSYINTISIYNFLGKLLRKQIKKRNYQEPLFEINYL